MERITISLPASVLERFRTLADERGLSVSALAREALEEKVTVRQPRPRSIGIAESGYTDTSEQAGEMRFKPHSWR